MTNAQQLNARREKVLQEMSSIRYMKKGSISEQWFPVIRDGKKTEQMRGPYYVLTNKTGNKTVSQRLSSKSKLEHVRLMVENHKRFVALCREFEELAEQLGELECNQPELEAVKKKPQSPSNRTKK